MSSSGRCTLDLLGAAMTFVKESARRPGDARRPRSPIMVRGRREWLRWNFDDGVGCIGSEAETRGRDLRWIDIDGSLARVVRTTPGSASGCSILDRVRLVLPNATREIRRPMSPNVRKWFDLPRLLHNYKRRMPLVLVNGLAEQSESWFANRSASVATFRRQDPGDPGLRRRRAPPPDRRRAARSRSTTWPIAWPFTSTSSSSGPPTTWSARAWAPR